MTRTPSRRALLTITLWGVFLTAACGGSPEAPLTTPAATGESVEPTQVSLPTSALPEPGTPLVFRNGLVVTATGADPIEAGAVVIENGLITAVGPDGTVNLPEGATVIDLEGRTILPGLIDGRASALLSNLALQDGELDGIYVDLYLGRPLEHGVTTVRATGWTWEEMQQTPDLQTALEAYGNSIPTVIISGASLAHSEGPAFTKYYPHQTVGVGTPEEARQMTQAIIELGADQVNFLMSSGPSLDETPEERAPVLSSEMLQAIVETAHDRNTPVVGQALFAEEALTAIEAGVDEIISWPTLTEPMPDDLLDAFVSNSVPVLSGFSVGYPQEGDIRRYLDAGGILVFGTFAPNSGSSPQREFALMARAGMTPMEMIRSATLNAANAVGLGDVVGTLEVGKRADIIVVDGNPLEEDFSSVLGNVVYVVKGGDLVVQPDQ